MRVLPVRPANIAWANASWRGLLDAGIFGLSGLLKKVFEVSRWATLIQDPSARRTKDSQPSGFGFEYCASHVRFRVFQQTASTTLADCWRARDSQITFSVTHGWSAFWRGRPWLAGRRIGETSLAVGLSRFWIGSQGTATNVPALRVGTDRS